MRKEFFYKTEEERQGIIDSDPDLFVIIEKDKASTGKSIIMADIDEWIEFALRPDRNSNLYRSDLEILKEIENIMPDILSALNIKADKLLALINYRQGLRDITKNISKPEDVKWPEK